MLSDTITTTMSSHPQAAYINGSWADGQAEKTLTIIDPHTEGTIAEFPGASDQQVDAAIASARTAFDSGAWSRRSPLDRSRALHGLADRFERDADRFAELLVAEIGSPIALVRAQQIDNSIELLRWFADAAARGPRQGYEEYLPLRRQPPASRSILLSEPAGVVAAITAYNFPLLLLIRKIGGALAAGCTTVVMPSPRAPLSTIEFLRLMEEVDLPLGTINLLVGDSPVGMRLTSDDRIDLITFTGSRSVGQQVMAQASAGIKKVVLELGGKSANIVLPGAYDDAIVRPSLMRFSLNAGQACGATTRSLVPRRDYDDYLTESRRVFGDLTVGDPRDPSTIVGPLISRDLKSSVQGYVDRAVSGGAVVEASATLVPGRGHYIAPQLIGNVENDSEISQEELFGPVGIILPFTTIDDAIALANANPFGLNANIWGPLPDALDVARRLRTGNVTINGGGSVRPDAPWGGYGASGIGREGGEEGFAEFFESKHVQWPPDNN